ncbi:MAG TPA: tetratricopeptide repeat protein [Phenylobacterium sp.]|nr:tetratricopeptide repeat protein [Phenylobacterium sp.]
MAATAHAQPPISEIAQRAFDRLRQHDAASALKGVNDGLAAYPDNPVLLATRGYVYIDLGDYQAAVPDMDQALARVPSANGYQAACWARALAGVELDQALAYCDKSLQLNPGRPWAQYDTRGFLHLRRGEYDQAVSDYGEALKLQPKQASSLYGRGLARLKLRQDQAGHVDLAAATKIEPGIVATYAKRGIVP